MSAEETEKESPSGSSEEEEEITQDFKSLLEQRRQQQNESNQYVNDEKGLLQKLDEIKLKIKGYDKIPWYETLVLHGNESFTGDVDDDLTREREFYDMSVKASIIGMKQVREADIPFKRPDDYFAEMMKTDQHMSKVKNVLLREKRKIEEAVERRRKRTQNKFNKQVQAEKQQQRNLEKKTEQEVIRRWRKMNKGKDANEFPVELLDPNSQLRKELMGKDKNQDNDNDKKSRRNSFKDREKKGKRMTNTEKKALKYGMGGRKRGMKRNTAESARDTSGWSSKRNRTGITQQPNKKRKLSKSNSSNRPGKRKRQQGWATSGGKKVKRQRTK